MIFYAARSTQQNFKNHQGVTTHSFIMPYLLASEHDICLLLLLNVSLVAVYLRHHHHHRHDHLSLRPIRPLLDLEDAVGLSIFVLVSPDHGVPTDNTVEAIVGDLPFF
jgi:uncharacterized membrane protein YeiH